MTNKKNGDSICFNSKKFSSKFFAKIRKTFPNRKLISKHKMVYVLPEIECKCCLKHIFQGEMSHFNHSTANFNRKPNYRGANTQPTTSI